MRFDVRWQSPQGKRVETLPTGPQQWYSAPYFGYVMAAKEWGLRPSALGLCEPEQDLAVMLMYVDSVNRMRTYEQLQQERKAKRR